MDLNECTLVELRQMAKDKGVKNVSKLKKEELIEILSDNKQINDEEKRKQLKIKDFIL